LAIFSRLAGFDPPIVERLEKEDRLKLEIASAWAFFGIFLSSFSVGYLFYFCMNSWMAGIFAGIFTGILLSTLQIALISGTFGNVALESIEFEKSKHLKTKLFIVIIAGLLLSQPILLLSFKYVYPHEIQKIAIEDKVFRRAELERDLKQRQAQFQRELAYHREYLNQIADATKPLSTNKDKAKEAAFLSNNRKALVIGNQAYPTARLNNPLKDANDMSGALTRMGFSVKTLLDGNQFEMERALVEYYETMRPGDISFIYFSGHGFQDHGNNYLVPVDFDLTDKSRAVSLNIIIESTSRKALLANVLVVDACRSYTFGSAGGLASTEAGVNTYIALSAKPGQFSLDGAPGSNGVFTAALLKNINQKTDVDTLFREVRKDVLKNTGNAQETWTSHSLNGTLILASSGGAINLDQIVSQSESEASGLSGISCAKIKENSSDSYKRAQMKLCGTARSLKLNDDLLAFEGVSKNKLINFDRQNDKSFITTTDILNAFYSVLKHLLFSVLGTLVITFLTTGGFIWRDVFAKESLKYEFIFHKTQRQRVYEIAKHYSSIAGKLPFANLDFVKKAYEVNYLGSRPADTDIQRGSEAKAIVMGMFK
jgi:hypothetical protein